MLLDQDLQEQKQEQEIKLSDTEIFTKIWISPRMVFKYLNDYSYEKFVTILLILAGITRTFDRASTRGVGDNMSLGRVIILCVILGGLLGWITYYIYAAMISWTGKWLNGKGDTKSILRTIAHAMTPSIVSLIFLIPQIALFGNGIFQSELDIYGSGWAPVIVFYVTLIIEITLTIWTIVIYVIGISEVQKISIGKSIINIILPGLILIVPIVVIMLIVR